MLSNSWLPAVLAIALPIVLAFVMTQPPRQ